MRFSFLNQYYFVKFRKGFFIICFSFFILFCLLGVWQIKRYHFKKKLLTTYHQRIMRPAQLFEAVLHQNNDLQFRVITAVGEFQNHLTFLIQNQLYHHQLGYEVITPFKIAEERKLLLIDRGWVKQSTDLQAIIHSAESHTIHGYINFLNQSQFILGKNTLNSKLAPMVMQKIDVHELEKITGKIFFPFIVRLNPTEPDGFIRKWTISTMPPQQHLAYAVQWFIMASILFVAYFCFCLERKVASK